MSNPSFPYSIRESSRARYLRFRVTLDKGLEVVVPRGYDRRRIPELLQTNHDWVHHALRRVDEALAIRRFFNRTNLQALALLNDFHELAGLHQAFEGTRVEPGGAAAEDAYFKGAAA